MFKPVSQMTQEERSAEIVLQNFKILLNKARKKQDKATDATQAVLDALEGMGIDGFQFATSAENADNLMEAIMCYINYGEYSEAGIMSEVRSAYGMGDLSVLPKKEGRA